MRKEASEKMDDFVLEFREVSKLFPGVVALDKVALGEARRGPRVDGGERRRQIDADEDHQRRA